MRVLIILLSMFPLIVQANFNLPKAQGFHWYSEEEKEQERKPVPMPQANPPEATTKIEPYEELLQVRRNTLNQLAEALLRPSVKSTKNYMRSQQAMVKRHQQFVQNWQRALMLNPSLDHRLDFPTDNSAIASRNEETKLLTEQVIKDSASKYGLLFFYKGKSALSQRFSKVILPFAENNGFSMISVTTDETVIESLPDSKKLPLAVINQRIELNERYLPTVFLVNLEKQSLSPLSYGFVALSDLKARFLDVATNFKRFSYEGLGE